MFTFFQKLRERELVGFRSALDIALKKAATAAAR
jgi:hypothetical protein